MVGLQSLKLGIENVESLIDGVLIVDQLGEQVQLYNVGDNFAPISHPPSLRAFLLNFNIIPTAASKPSSRAPILSYKE